MKGWLLFILILFTIPGCAQKTIDILFVGNSLTYTNDLPAQVKTLAKTKGLKLEVETLAFPNYALEDHWNDGELQRLIATKNYEFVMVQQGPSSQADGRTMLMEYGERINLLCTQHNARLGFLMVWPSKINYSTFDGVIKNYTDAADHCNAILFPVGKEWKQYMDTSQNFMYYGPDGFHPSRKGTEVAAEIITHILLVESKR